MGFSETTLTALELTGMGVVPYSTRQATQTLEPIKQAGANVRRDVNGVLRMAGGSQFQKFRSTISCRDQAPAAFDGVWPGKLVTVACIQELAYEDVTGAAPQRDSMTGSERIEGGWVFYRPVLSMMVTSFSMQTDEYSAEVSWTMELEEV